MMLGTNDKMQSMSQVGDQIGGHGAVRTASFSSRRIRGADIEPDEHGTRAERRAWAKRYGRPMPPACTTAPADEPSTLSPAQVPAPSTVTLEVAG